MCKSPSPAHTILLALLIALFAILPSGADAIGAINDGADYEQTSSGEEGEDDNAGDDLAIDSLEDARQAVVLIEAVGTFIDPDQGLLANAAGRGTGFIIDEAGIAVTNNHVVTGGALFNVYVDGSDKPLNARVLGVDECADLAVIDIQGSGYPYLQWRDGSPKVGLDVFAVGYPLGDPEYTMTRGIISKERASGETSWASVDDVLQHDATLNPGNSGGPLLDAEGQVVGVNYRRNNADQFFAIAGDEAQPIVEQLRGGEDIDSIGVNSMAVNNGEDIYGIWVSSVDSGSPADVVGLIAGDIILSIEGVDLATDGTMATYCDILRSNSPDDVLGLSVLRLDTDEVLNGQLNGRELEQSFTLTEEPTESSAAPVPAGESYTEYRTITDEQGILSIEVPAAWADVTESPWESDDEIVGVELFASTNLDDFFDNWGIPGLIMSYSDMLLSELEAGALLYDYSESCEGVEEFEIPDGFFTGVYDVWTGCGDDASAAWIMELVPETNDYILGIQIYAATDADVEAVDRILESFIVTPPVAPEGEADVDDPASGQDTGEFLNEYVLVEDVAVSALIPDSWSDVRSEDWIVDDEVIGSIFTASTDLEKYDDGWTVPGFAAYSALETEDATDPVEALDDIDFSDSCTYVDRVAHEHTTYGITYTGAFDIWSNCDGGDNSFVVLSAVSDPVDHAIFILIQGSGETDLEAFDVLGESFYVETEVTAPIIAENLATLEREQTTAEREYVSFADADGLFALYLPAEWTDTVNEDWVIDDEVVGRTLTAAEDVIAFEDDWEAQGVFLAVSADVAEYATSDDILDVFEFSDDCVYDDRYEYVSETLDGKYDIWNECGGLEYVQMVTLAGTPADSDSPAFILAMSLADEDALSIFDTLAATLSFDGEATESAVAGQPSQATTATVVVNALNMRNGPGTNYNRVGGVRAGDVLTVLGQVNNCRWLFVATPDNRNGWVSGSDRYVTLAADCADIPETEAPGSSAAAGQAPGQSAGTVNATEGCYLFQNQLGAELTITFSRKDSDWNKTFKVAPKDEVEQCFDPGSYSYTLDAPPPWGSTNGLTDISAGDYYLFPISPE